MSSFLILIVALAATIMNITNPVWNLRRFTKGKTYRQVNRDIKIRIESLNINESRSIVWLTACKWGCFAIGGVVFTYIIYPIYVLTAITNKIGNQTISYAIFALLVFLWITRVNRVIKVKKSGSFSNNNQLDNEDQLIKFGNSYTIAFYSVLYALPVVYLWYLFAVAVGVIQF